MPVIRIPDPVFERLQSIAKPFVDTPASVIERLLDFYQGGGTQPQPPKVGDSRAVLTDFDPEAPPDLRHARVLYAEVGGEKAAGWNELVQLAHRHAAVELKGNLDALKSATLSNMSVGRRSDSGFHYVGDPNISIQNVEANNAWRNTLHLAKRFNFETSVVFEWADKKGAALPGKQGRLSWNP